MTWAWVVGAVVVVGAVIVAVQLWIWRDLRAWLNLIGEMVGEALDAYMDQNER